MSLSQALLCCEFPKLPLPLLKSIAFLLRLIIRKERKEGKKRRRRRTASPSSPSTTSSYTTPTPPTLPLSSTSSSSSPSSLLLSSSSPPSSSSSSPSPVAATINIIISARRHRHHPLPSPLSPPLLPSSPLSPLPSSSSLPSTSSSVPFPIVASITIIISALHLLLHSFSSIDSLPPMKSQNPSSTLSRSFSPNPSSTIKIRNSSLIVPSASPPSTSSTSSASSLPAAMPSTHLPPLSLPLLLRCIRNSKVSSSRSVASVDEPPPPLKKTPPHVTRSYSIGSSRVRREGGDRGGDGRRLRTRSARAVVGEPPSSLAVVGTAI